MGTRCVEYGELVPGIRLVREDVDMLVSEFSTHDKAPQIQFFRPLQPLRPDVNRNVAKAERKKSKNPHNSLFYKSF